jgi:hypothetical protein
LAKFHGKNIGDYATNKCLGFLGWFDTNTSISICVILPKVTKASKAQVIIDSMIVSIMDSFALMILPM